MAQSSALERTEAALQRAAVYELLAHLFAYPDAERVAALRESASEVLTAGASIPLMRLAAVAREASTQELEPVYVSLTTFSSSPDCPSFESAYVGGDAQRQTQRMADIAGFYRAFGVDTGEGGLRPDDISVELEFMAYLCRKEAFAEQHLGAPRAGQARRAQRMFLSEHLGTWARVFGQKFAGLAPVGHLYSVAGDTLAAWLVLECESAGVTPEELSADSGVHWPAPTSHGPEFAGEPSFVPIEELAVR